MKAKVLISALLSTLLSAQAYAIEIHDGRIISHKEWSTENTRGFFHAGNMSKFLLNKSFKNRSKNSNTDHLISVNDISPVTGTINAPVAITGIHNILIQNNSTNVKHYVYVFSLCAETGESTESCTYYRDYIELNAGGSFGNNNESNLQITFNTAMDYGIAAITDVYGVDGNSQPLVTSISTSQATIS